MDGGAEWREDGERVATSCARHLPDLLGVYVHGSAALGGMTRGSDLDVLVVSRTDAGVPALLPALLVDAGVRRPLELSVVTCADAAAPAAPWPFVGHVNSAAGHVVNDGGAGDADLLAHYAVTRSAGIALTGPTPRDVIGPVDRVALLRYLIGELRWGATVADERYAVLNACRAVAYAEEGLLLSKLDGAHWWRTHRGPSVVVDRAGLAQSEDRDLGAAGDRAQAFIARCAAVIRDAAAGVGQA